MDEDLVIYLQFWTVAVVKPQSIVARLSVARDYLNDPRNKTNIVSIIRESISLSKVELFPDDASISMRAESVYVDLLLSLGRFYGHKRAFRKIAKTQNGSRKYATFAVACGSQDANERSVLMCDKDVENVRQYACKYNYFMGFQSYLGTAADKCSILKQITEQCSIAMGLGLCFVLYYTGHGNRSGNWAVGQNFITLTEVMICIRTARLAANNSSLPVFVVSDCCYAGKWCDLLSALTSEHNADPHIKLICASSMEAVDDTFTPAFFKCEEFLNLKKKRTKAELTTAINKVLNDTGEPPYDAQSSKHELEEALREAIAEKTVRARKCEPELNGEALRKADFAFHWFNSDDDDMEDLSTKVHRIVV